MEYKASFTGISGNDQSTSYLGDHSDGPQKFQFDCKYRKPQGHTNAVWTIELLHKGGLGSDGIFKFDN